MTRDEFFRALLRAAKEAGADEAEAYFAEDESFRALASKGQIDDYSVNTAGGVSLRNMWERRQATKFNGVPYIVQRAAEAALTEQGIAECRGLITYYMENAKLIAGLLQRKGIFFTGGQSSPYLWLRCPGGMDSWTFFDYLLQKAEVVGTPGSGFGSCGEGFFRLTAFGSHEGTAEAVARLEKLL